MPDSLFFEGLTFTAGAFLLMGGLAWWFFWSPLRGEKVPVKAPDPGLAGWIAAWLGLGGFQITVGAFWDASRHITEGRAVGGSDFLWAPHIMIYSTFLIALLVAGVGTYLVARPAWRRGERDPRAWVRSSPWLGVVAVAALFQLLSVPGDAIWHELYGLDLTAWSPPHLLLFGTECVVLIAAAVMVAGTRPRPRWHDAAVISLLGLMLGFGYLVGVIEWETPGGRSIWVEARPIWLYPLVAGLVGLAASVIARRFVQRPWAATLTWVVFYGVRAAATGAMLVSGNLTLRLPLVALLGAVLVDLLPYDRIAGRVARALAVAAAYTAGFAAVALPQAASRPDLALKPLDLAVTVLLMAAAGFVLALPVTGWRSAAAESR